MNKFFQILNWIKRINIKRREPLVKQFQRQETEGYWYRRQWLRNLQFSLANKLFRFQRWQLAQRENFSVFSTLTRIIVGQVLTAILFVTCLELLENVFKIYTSINIPNLNMPDLDSNAYLGLATTIVGLTGAFLALYFTAITVVASTVYSEVADDVRGLLIEEKFGNVYFRAVSFLAVVAVLITGMLVLKYSPGVLNLLALVFLSAFSIFSFVTLGLKTLDFFNPAPLLGSVDI